MANIIMMSMQNVVHYYGWIIFWILIMVVPATIEVWITLKKYYNHKGYWLNGVDLERYVDDVPVEVPKE